MKVDFPLDRFSNAIRKSEWRFEECINPLTLQFRNLDFDFKIPEPQGTPADELSWRHMTLESFFFSALRKSIQCHELFCEYQDLVKNNIFDHQSLIMLRLISDLSKITVIEIFQFREALSKYLINYKNFVDVFDRIFPGAKDARDAISHAAERRIGYAHPVGSKYGPINVEEKGLFASVRGAELEFLPVDGKKARFQFGPDLFEKYIIDCGFEVKLADFDYTLPEALIALHPVAPRHAARLLRVEAGAQNPFSDHHFIDLPGLLRAGDVLVFNNTRVIPARLIGQRVRGENSLPVEALLIKRLDAARWEAFAKPGKRLKPGDALEFGTDNPLIAHVEAKGEGGVITLAFTQSGATLDVAIVRHGAMPLPPYILDARKRMGDDGQGDDHADYQTLFAQKDGAVAAPTASLHFTPEVMAKLNAAQIGHAFLTLHVGAGTFLPVKEGAIDAHKMHAEWGEIAPDVADHLNAIRAAGGRIIAVGTTVARLLESATDEAGRIHPFMGETSIFIRPGYRFRAVDALITNFHLPKSTLLMLVAAFCGLKTMRAAYAHAIEKGYRFYSYGDSSLLFPASSSADL